MLLELWFIWFARFATFAFVCGIIISYLRGAQDGACDRLGDSQ